MRHFAAEDFFIFRVRSIAYNLFAASPIKKRSGVTKKRII